MDSIKKILQIFGFKISQNLVNWQYPDIKTSGAVIDYMYEQNNAGIITATICATVLFFGIFLSSPKSMLFIWYSFFLIVTAARFVLMKLYKSKYHEDTSKYKWLQFFVLGAALAGISWGIVGTFLLPNTPRLAQLLIVLILAGVAAGSLPLLSGSLIAISCFLTPLVLPVAIFFLKQSEYQYILVGLTILFYWVFLLVLAKKTNELLLRTVQLQFEKDELLKNLFSAKTALEAANVKLKDAATHDSLTKLPNRTFFLFFLETALRRAKRLDTLVAIFYFDLDGFKNVNDKFGHAMGDKILIAVTNRLRSKIRSQDFLARLGGDEFCLIAENIKTVEGCYPIAENICKLIAKPFVIDGIVLNISASLGISIYPLDAVTPEVLLAKADSAMYHIKKTSKNNFCFSHQI